MKNTYQICRKVCHCMQIALEMGKLYAHVVKVVSGFQHFNSKSIRRQKMI